jgi:TetR/AcrR family tetracycline transcriptional repressor
LARRDRGGAIERRREVARPKVPLVSRRATLEAGLRIVDAEGLDALTIRRLATELNINGASLYHHFANKDEILAGVAALALEDVRTPTGRSEDWREWLLRNFEAYRHVLLAHPSLVPVLLRRHPLRIGLREHNATASLLAVQGVPADLVMPLVESLEAIALGSVLYSSAVENDPQSGDWRDDYPHLYYLASQVGLGPDETFQVVCKSVIDAFARIAEERVSVSA